MATENTAWQLEELVDSLVVELDKTRESLAVRAINKAITYTVKDLALDLNIFPSYDGDQVKFVTAQPGEQGASKVTIQLGSITDQQVRATSKVPGLKSDVKIEDMNVNKATRKKLRRLGVNSLDDLQQIERKNVDLKTVSESDIDYRTLANQIQKSKRSQSPPRVAAVSLAKDDDGEPYLLIQGDNLAVDKAFPPVAVINRALAEVMSSSPQEVRVQLTGDHNFADLNEVIVTFDPFAVIKVNVKT